MNQLFDEAFQEILKEIEKENKIWKAKGIDFGCGGEIINSEAYGIYLGLEKALKIVQRVAEENKKVWIPCGERLPSRKDIIKNKSAYFLTSDSFGRIPKIRYFDISDGRWYESRENRDSIVFDINAWIPLLPEKYPESYKEREDRWKERTEYWNELEKYMHFLRALGLKKVDNAIEVKNGGD